MAYVIFDLDGTVICSKHRQATLPDGSLDLAHWFDNARPELIYQDSLLPLARSMRAIHRAGHTIIICTARCLQQADHDFLANNDLPFHVMLSRYHEGMCPEKQVPLNSDMRPDAEMKEALLEEYFRKRGFPNAAAARAVMFDDNLKVIAKMKEIGISCINATTLNRSLRR